MTGYGRGVAQQQGNRVTVELTSVNRRQLEVSVSLPRELEALEPRVKEFVSGEASRGRVSVKVTWHISEEVAGARINRALARSYAKELRKLAKDLKLGGDLTLESLMRVPGVLGGQDDGVDCEAWWVLVSQALGKALKGLVKMRVAEGGHLARELKGRIKLMEAGVKRVEKLAPGVLERYREQLRERVKQAGLEMPAVDDERLAKEIVYFADRSDVTEELARLASHFKQFEECLVSKEPVGRTLDFLAQEMNREVNTLGSKANDRGISREVVILKTELEKFREQAQNVE